MDNVINGIGTICVCGKEHMCPYFTLYREIECDKIK